MSTLQQSASGKKDGDIRYLTPLNIETNKLKKYCRFKKSGIKYIDYKDADFLLKFVSFSSVLSSIERRFLDLCLGKSELSGVIIFFSINNYTQL